MLSTFSHGFSNPNRYAVTTGSNFTCVMCETLFAVVTVSAMHIGCAITPCYHPLELTKGSIFYSPVRLFCRDSAAAPTSGECTNEWKDNVAVAPENRQTPTIDFVDPYDPASFVGRRLSDDGKLSLLTSKFALPEGYKIEATGGRRFQESWAEERPWLRYSVSKKTAFCLSCLCFGKFDRSDPYLSPFVSKGFCNWKKAVGKKDGCLEKHMQSELHQDAEMRASCFLATRQPGIDIGVRLSRQIGEQQERVKGESCL